MGTIQWRHQEIYGNRRKINFEKESVWREICTLEEIFSYCRILEALLYTDINYCIVEQLIKLIDWFFNLLIPTNRKYCFGLLNSKWPVCTFWTASRSCFKTENIFKRHQYFYIKKLPNNSLKKTSDSINVGTMPLRFVKKQFLNQYLDFINK